MIATLTVALSAPIAAQDQNALPLLDRESKEYQFAACVNERDQSLLYAMRDAADVEAFQGAAARAGALCNMKSDERFSMGKFFDAVASFIGKPEYKD